MSRTAPPYRHRPAAQRGAIFVLVAAAIPVIIGMAAIAVDVAYVIYNKERLQSIVSAAALAAGQDLMKEEWSVVENTAKLYSARWATGEGVGGTDNPNVLANNVVVNAPRIEGRALGLSSVPIGADKAASGFNAIRVTQTAEVPLWFTPALGNFLGPIRIGAQSTASAGGRKSPLNVMLLVDITGSMSTADSNCGLSGSPRKVNCAKFGARTLVANLLEKNNNTGLIVFPPMNSATAVARQSDCTVNVACNDLKNYMAGGLANPQSGDRQPWQDSEPDNSDGYSNYSTIVPLSPSSDYAVNFVSLNNDHALAKALGANNCTGLETPGPNDDPTNDDKLTSTYYCRTTFNGGNNYVLQTSIEQAIREAQRRLSALSAINLQKNVIILLSDGDANSTTFSELTNATTGKSFAAVTGRIDNGLATNNPNYCRGTTLTVTAVGYGELKIGQRISSDDTPESDDIQNNSTVAAFDTGTGGIGTYTITHPDFRNAVFTGQIHDGSSRKRSGTRLYVSNIQSGSLQIGQVISGSGIQSCTWIQSGPSGSGSSQYYTLNKAHQITSNTSMTAEPTSPIVSSRSIWSHQNMVSSFIPNQCQAAVKAANEAKTAGTKIFVVGYGVASGGCGEDETNLSPINDRDINACKTLQWISGEEGDTGAPNTRGSLPYFYTTAPTNVCRADDGHNASNLEQLFEDIAYNLGGSRLIPDDAE